MKNLDARFNGLQICSAVKPGRDFNLKRLQRYISVAASSKIKSVILLTKSDLCDKKDELFEEVRKAAPDKEIFAISSFDESTEKLLGSFVKPGISAVFIGSSGVGKSTLINTLSGSAIRVTGEISSAVRKGRHTTSARELILLPSGGMVIDTPGMRELGMWAAESGLSASFADIEAFAEKCRFRDCTHTTEPGCAVRKAIENGELSEERLLSYKKLEAENSYSEDSQSYLAAKEEKFKRISKVNKSNRKR